MLKHESVLGKREECFDELYHFEGMKNARAEW
jgi:hypothetical protein